MIRKKPHILQRRKGILDSIRALFTGKSIRFILALLLAVHFIKGLLLAGALPLWQAPDEPAYFKEVEIIVKEGKIPSFTAPSQTGHPPLSSIIEAIPLLIWKPANFNLQVFLSRLVNVIIGTFVVLIAYSISTLIFPNNSALSLLSAGFVAFNPQFSFISASVTADNLLTLIFSLYLLILVRTFFLRMRFIDLLLLVILALIGLYTKERFMAAFAILIVWGILTFLLYFGRGARWLPSTRLGKALLISIFCFLLLQWLPLLTLFWHPMELPRMAPLSLFNIFFGSGLFTGRIVVVRLFKEFWGYFGNWARIPLWDELYFLLAFIMLISFIGLLIAVIKSLLVTETSTNAHSQPIQIFSGRQFAALYLCFIAAFSTWYAVIYYNLMTAGGAQGKYLLMAVVPISLLIATGLASGYSQKAGNNIILTIVFLTMLVITFISIYLILIPWYYISKGFFLEKTPLQFFSPTQIFYSLFVPTSKYTTLIPAREVFIISIFHILLSLLLTIIFLQFMRSRGKTTDSNQAFRHSMLTTR